MRQRPWVPRPVIDDMLDVMPSRGLVIHEYRTHGTCSGLDPAQYFKLAREVFESIKIPNRYRNPLAAQRVAPRDIIGGFLKSNPDLSADMIAITCGGSGNRLRDVRICVSKDGRPRACGYNENQRRLCRAGTMYVPPVRSNRRGDTHARPPSQDHGALPQPRVIKRPAAN